MEKPLSLDAARAAWLADKNNSKKSGAYLLAMVAAWQLGQLSNDDAMRDGLELREHLKSKMDPRRFANLEKLAECGPDMHPAIICEVADMLEAKGLSVEAVEVIEDDGGGKAFALKVSPDDGIGTPQGTA